MLLSERMVLGMDDRQSIKVLFAGRSYVCFLMCGRGNNMIPIASRQGLAIDMIKT